LLRLGLWVESPGLLAEQDDDGYDEGKGGDNELRHVDPENCLGHVATVPWPVAYGFNSSKLGIACDPKNPALLCSGRRNDTTPPEWELWSNLRLLCGNVCGMSVLQSGGAKILAFTDCCGGT
jgi:hypothetical protein